MGGSLKGFFVGFLFIAMGLYGAMGLVLSHSTTARGLSNAQMMQVRLNGVSLGMLGYLQTHKSEYLTAVKVEGQTATMFLKRFRAESSGNLPALTARIEQAHEAQREDALAILSADNAEQEARLVLEKNRAELLQILQEKLLMTARAAAWRSSDRLRWLLTAVAEAKGLQADASGVSGNPTLFINALDHYRQEASLRQLPVIEEAHKKWAACVVSARQVAAQESNKISTLRKFTQARADLDQAIDDYLRVNVPLAAKGYGGYGLAGGCFLVGLIMLVRGISGRRHYKKALHAMTLWSEAVAAGDLSRTLDPVRDVELDALAKALARLSPVLTRSENLVYHLAALVEASGDAIVSQNLDGTILSWNKGAQRIYGYSIEEVRGHSIGILSGTDGGSELRIVLERVKHGEKVTPFEALHQAKNGRLVRALVKVSAIYDSLHKVIGVSFCAQELPSTATSSTAIPITDTLQRS